MLKIGMIVFPSGHIRPQIYMVADIVGQHAELKPLSLGAMPLQSPTDDLRRYRIRSTDEVTHQGRPVRVVGVENPFTEDLYIYRIETEDGLEEEVAEYELELQEGSLFPDPADMLAQLDLAPWELTAARIDLLDSYFNATAKSLGIVGYNGARMLPIPHQVNAARYALQFGRIRFLLADEVGLGKTVEAGLIVSTVRKYFPNWQTAVFTPESLTAQWAFEMYGKFGKLVFALNEEDLTEDDPGVILPHHRAMDFARNHKPDILIVDEAHRILRHEEMVDAFLEMSRSAHVVLLLTATPVSDDMRNLVRLLNVLDPETLGHLKSADALRLLMDKQREMELVLHAIRDTPEDHDAIVAAWGATGIEDEEIATHLERAGSDLASRHDLHRMAALIIDRYYPGSRILRYRRKFLIQDNAMPIRVVDGIDYKAAGEELDAVAAMGRWLKLLADAGLAEDFAAQPVAGALIQATHSSPLALMDWVKLRKGELEPRDGVTADPVRLARRAFEKLGPLPDEAEVLADLETIAEKWTRNTRAMDTTLRPLATTGRYLAFLDFLKGVFEEDPDAHVLVFTSFEANVHPVCLATRKALADVAEVFQMCGVQSRVEREKNAFEFQEFGGGCVLISDDLGGEGRNFQFASHVVHYDLPLGPWMVEQRIGRCDRVGREEEMDVDSQVVVAKGGLDEVFFDFLADGIGVFNDSIAPVEAQLDRIMQRVMARCINEGAAGVLDMMEPTQDNLEEARERENADLMVRSRVGVEEARALATHLDDQNELAHLERAAVNFARLFDSMVDAQEGGRYAFTVGEYHTLHGVAGVRGEMIGYFNRRSAVRHERLEFFSPGHPYIRNMAQTTLLDSPDRTAVVRRHGIKQPAYVAAFRVSVPAEFIQLVRQLPVDLRPPLLSRSAALFPTKMLRLVLTGDGELIPRIEGTEIYHRLECPGDQALTGLRELRGVLPENWSDEVLAAGAVAMTHAEEIADQILDENREELEDLLCEVLTRTNPSHELVESQIEEIMGMIAPLTIDFEAMWYLTPAKR